MAMIKCIECGKEFSDRAEACPNCGCPTSETTGIKKDINVASIVLHNGISSEEATKRMEDAVEEAKRAASTADREFDRSNSRIQRMASSRIDLFGNDTVTRVADIAMEAKKACDDLYAALQLQVATLDGICRPLLISKPNGTAIKDVYFAIKQFNSDSEISNTFTASVNYDNLGDVATRRYSPSVQAKMIENYWRGEYEKVKGEMSRLEAERKAREEAKKKQAAEKKQKELQAFQAENKAIIDDYDKKAKQSVTKLTDLEMKSFEKKMQTAKQNRTDAKNAFETKISKETEEKISKIEKEQSTFDQTYVDTIKSLRIELDENKATLSSLGFFKGAEKKKMNAKIEELVNKLQETTNHYKEKLDKNNKAINKYEQEKTNSVNTEFEAINKRYPLPELIKYVKRTPQEKVKEIENRPTAMQLVNSGMKDAIYDYMIGQGLVTITDILMNCPEAADLTNQRVSAYVRQLVSEGRVERIEEKRMAYFRANEGYETKKKLPVSISNPVEDVEKLVREKKQVSFNAINVKDKNNKLLEEYEIYGCLKFLAIDSIIYCDDKLNVYYIPEEYRKIK